MAVRRISGALLIATALAGCASEPTIAIREWSVESPLGSPRGTITLPAKVDVPSPQPFVLRTELVVPAELRGKTLTLAVPQVEGRTTLLVDGQAIAPLDDPGPGWRGDRAPRWRIPSERTNVATLPLAIELDNAALQSSRLSTIPRLSATAWGDGAFRATKSLNHVSSAIALGALLGMFVTYAVLWLLNRRRRAFGFMALAALTAISSPLLWLDVAQYVFGKLELVFVAVVLAIGGLAMLESLFDHFVVERPKRGWWYAAAALLAMLLLTLVFPGLAGITGISALIYNYAAMAWIGVMLARVSRRTPPPPDFRVMGLALGALFVSTLPAAAWRFGVHHPFEGVVLTPLGMTLFLLIHSISLSRSYVATMSKADALNVELAARIDQLEVKNREVNVLNVELRRQIADRSQKLADALARIEGVTSATRGLREGELIDGRYRVLRPLGAGGMGAVYEVERVTDGGHFALKVLRGETTGPALSRFAREAEIAARIDHPNLVSVVDVDVAETGALYIVMELVSGASLESYRDRYADSAWALPILAQTAEGLAALHAERVVHRDLKPGNVLLDDNGRVKIADFGISALREAVDPLAVTSTPEQLAHKSTPELTQTGAMLGTPLYMAPELWRGADRASESSDVFSLGLIAYVLLAARYPWDAPPIYDIGAGRKVDEPASLEGVSPAIAEAVRRAVSFDPRIRPSAREIAEVVRQHLV